MDSITYAPTLGGEAVGKYKAHTPLVPVPRQTGTDRTTNDVAKVTTSASILLVDLALELYSR